MRVSSAVMAHPGRTALVEQLIGSLDRDVPVYWDPGGPPSGNGDRVWSVARGAWSMSDPAADYHVLIQDDAIACPDLLAGIEQALDYLPVGAILSPYLGTGRMAPQRWDHLVRMADASVASFVRADRLMWGVCLAVPTVDVPDMLAWCDRKGGVPDDMRVAGWAKRNDREVWYTWPSLIDHRTVPSLTKHRALDRVARRHHLGSALEIDWSGPVVTDPMLLRRKGPRSGARRVRSVRPGKGQEGRNSA